MHATHLVDDSANLIGKQRIPHVSGGVSRPVLLTTHGREKDMLKIALALLLLALVIAHNIDRARQTWNDVETDTTWDDK